jgi:hypothetical protein
MRIFEDTAFNSNTIYNSIQNTLIDQGVVFFGAFALSLYNKHEKNKLNFKSTSPDFDVLSEDPKKTATIIKDQLSKLGYDNIDIYEKPGIGEIIAPHYEILYNKQDTLAYIYKPNACHSFNIIKINNKEVKVATIDTIMSFYLAFMFTNRKYYDINRLFCMAHFLFKLQQKYRLSNINILKRFSLNCYGKQETIEDIRTIKSEKFKEMKHKYNKDEYNKYFFKYSPETSNLKKTKKQYKKKYKKQTTKNKSKKKSKNKSKKQIKHTNQKYKQRK